MEIQSLPLVALARIDESPTNPRKTFDGLAELADDLRRRGMLQPVMLRPVGDRFELIFGARRYRAAQLAALDAVPAIVREMSDAEVLETQLVENAKRADVHPLEEAVAYHALHTTHGYAVEDLAAKVGKSLTHVYERLRLCGLAPAAREAYAAGRLNHKVAVLVARIPPALQPDAVKDLTRRYADGSDDPLSAREAADHVQRKFMLRLADAPFDRADAALVPKAGACTACPKRTGNQPELFADVKSKDLCTDPTCHAGKVDAEWKRRAAATAKAGGVVLAEKQARGLFPYSDQLSHSAPYVDLAAQCYDDPKGRTYRQLLGKEAPPVVLARDPRGGIHELVTKADAAKALQASGKVKTPTQTAATGTDSKAAEKKRRAQLVVKRAALAAATAAIVAAVAKKPPGDGLWRVLVQAMLDASWHDVAVGVAKRRGIEVQGKYKAADDALAAHAKGLKGADLLGLVTELLITRGVYSEYTSLKGSAFEAACGLYKVDMKAHEATARAEQKAPRGQKTLPATAPAKRPKAAGRTAAAAAPKAATAPVAAPDTARERVCRECGCTDDRACDGGCIWVEPDLCSKCDPEDDLGDDLEAPSPAPSPKKSGAATRKTDAEGLPFGPLMITLLEPDLDALLKDDAELDALCGAKSGPGIEWFDGGRTREPGVRLVVSTVIAGEQLAHARRALTAAGVWWAESLPTGEVLREVAARAVVAAPAAPAASTPSYVSIVHADWKTLGAGRAALEALVEWRRLPGAMVAGPVAADVVEKIGAAVMANPTGATLHVEDTNPADSPKAAKPTKPVPKPKGTKAAKAARVAS